MIQGDMFYIKLIRGEVMNVNLGGKFDYIWKYLKFKRLGMFMRDFFQLDQIRWRYILYEDNLVLEDLF